ncbi:hypothetical protein AVEN_177670-1 [Araneus ventricosus]|uniref:Uncharacterized protein n=1 Tax=Araneus ventricosus TaxID=182803 RepID=A0A4Y2VYR9_ARAVE|nr:hypothetical protein AVEN_177670-1 [Araneus ventricosus]
MDRLGKANVSEFLRQRAGTPVYFSDGDSHLPSFIGRRIEDKTAEARSLAAQPPMKTMSLAYAERPWMFQGVVQFFVDATETKTRNFAMRLMDLRI